MTLGHIATTSRISARDLREICELKSAARGLHYAGRASSPVFPDRRCGSRVTDGPRRAAHAISGATVIPGIMGYGAHRGVHRKGLIGAPHDKPVTLLVIENEAKIPAVLPTLRPMVIEGIFVLIDAGVIPLP